MEGVHHVPLREAMVYTQRNPGGELPLASSSRCSASRRTNGRSASNVPPPPEVKKPGGGLGMLERPGKRGEAEGP